MNVQVKVFFINQMDEGRVAGRVLEVGAYNVNGSLKEIFPDAVGVDMRAGRGVDVVCDAADLVGRFGPESFDTVLTAETFEHFKDWRAATRGMWGVLKTGGWLIATMASVHKGKHDYPHDYWRMEAEHILSIWPQAHVAGDIGPVSIGWAVRKEGPLPDLEAIELLSIDDLERSAA